MKPSGLGRVAATTQFERPVFARLRKLCLAFPEVTEAPAWGHPNFRVGRKTFCTFEFVNGRPSIAFKLPAADAGRLAQTRDWLVTPYGRGTWVSAWVDVGIDWRGMSRMLERSYRQAANKRLVHLLDSRREGRSKA